MRGHEPLIEMRRKGVKPAVVFIDTDAAPILPKWAQWQNVSPRLCTIDIDPSDQLRRLDMRPLVGMVVHVSGTDAERIRAVATLAVEAGAKRVISSCSRQIGHGEWIAFQNLWMHDTAGHLTTEQEHGATAE